MEVVDLSTPEQTLDELIAERDAYRAQATGFVEVLVGLDREDLVEKVLSSIAEDERKRAWS